MGGLVSTHSRPKAAGILLLKGQIRIAVSTHSRPKAAGTVGARAIDGGVVSTHSRPKAAGFGFPHTIIHARGFQHTAARRRLVADNDNWHADWGFNTQPPEGGWLYAHLREREAAGVSTHSRPKAAGLAAQV